MICKNCFPDTKTYVLKFTEWRCKVLFSTFLCLCATIFRQLHKAILTKYFISLFKYQRHMTFAVVKRTKLFPWNNSESIFGEDGGWRKIVDKLYKLLGHQRSVSSVILIVYYTPLLTFNCLPLIYLIRYRMRLILWKRIIAEDFIPVPAYG